MNANHNVIRFPQAREVSPLRAPNQIVFERGSQDSEAASEYKLPMWAAGLVWMGLSALCWGGVIALVVHH